MIEFVLPSDEGRHYRGTFSVRLGDADSSGQLRLDGVARILQDVATDDWDDTGIAATETWVVRRTAVRVANGGRWPRYKERLTVTTWCGGFGAAWAERRTDIAVDDKLLVQAAALWVPVDATRHPVRLRPLFFEIYGGAMRGRKVPGRVDRSALDADAVLRPWPLRRADLDILGHVNNAAVWQAVTEVVVGPVNSVTVTHHGPIESGHEVTLASSPGALWLLVNGVIAVSATFAS